MYRPEAGTFQCVHGVGTYMVWDNEVGFKYPTLHIAVNDDFGNLMRMPTDGFMAWGVSLANGHEEFYKRS